MVLVAAATAAVIALAALIWWVLPLGGDGSGSTPTTVGPGPGQPGWVDAAALPFASASAGVGAVDGKIWVAGGLEDDGVSARDTVVVFDPVRGEWTEGPPLISGRAFPTVVGFGGNELLVIGGTSDGEVLDEVLALLPDRQGWRPLPPLPEARHSGAAVHDGGRVVYGGGVDADGEDSASTFVFDRSSWSAGGDLRVPRRDLTAISPVPGEVWFAGGTGAQDTDPPQESEQLLQGEAIPVLPAQAVAEPMRFAAAVPVEDNGICLLGTRTAQDQALSWQCANTALTDALPPLEPARTHFGSAVIDNTLYIVGGQTSDGTPTDRVQALDLGGYAPVPGTDFVALSATESNWVDTGITVEPGARLHITAQGRISDNVAMPGRRFDADGEEGLGLPDRYSQFPHATLLGRIGQDGEPFAIGADTVLDDIPAQAPGPLHLFINDQSGLDNGGSYWVTISAA